MNKDKLADWTGYTILILLAAFLAWFLPTAMQQRHEELRQHPERHSCPLCGK